MCRLSQRGRGGFRLIQASGQPTSLRLESACFSAAEKDSLFAFGVLRELFGIESVIPLSYSYSELDPVQHRERRLKFCENPLQRNTGAEIAPVFTNISFPSFIVCRFRRAMRSTWPRFLRLLSISV